MKIKQNIYITIALFGLSSMALALPENITNYIGSATVTEDGEMSGTAAQQTEFIDYVRDNWSSLLDNIETVAPTTREQVVIIAAAENLPGRTYLDFISKLCDKKEVGQITELAFRNTVIAITPKKTGLFAYNYQDPQVIQLVQRLKGLLQEDESLQSFLDEVLSGDAVEGAENATVGHNLPEPELLAPIE